VPESNGQTSEMRYLLGTLSPAEMDLIDEALFQSDAKAQEMELAETELIDAYVRDELTAADRQRFKERLQYSPALLERVWFAEALRTKISQSVKEVEPAPPPRPSWWRQLIAQPAFAVAITTGVVVAIGGGVALVLALRGARNESNQMAAERSVLIEENKKQQQQAAELRAKAEQLEADLHTERNQRAQDQKLIEHLQHEVEQSSGELPTSIASIFLTPGSVRGPGSRQQLPLRAGINTVKLRLSIDPADYSSYSVSVESGDVVVFSHDRLKARRDVLVVSIPARRLPPGDYVVHVNGARAAGPSEGVGDYQFRVQRQR
jgi:hypothetical protein